MRKLLILIIFLLPSIAFAQGPVDSSGRPYVNATDGTGPFTVDGTLTCNAGTGTLAVSGPLTDAELRATAVPVSGTFLLDATYTGRTPAGATPADNESNTNAALSRVGSYLFRFDGAQWDRWGGEMHIGGNGAAIGNNGPATATTLRVTVADDSTGEIRVADNAGNQVESAIAAPAAGARGWVVRPIGRCKNELNSFASIDIVTATTTLIVTGVGGQHVYLCSIALMTAGANNVAFVAGTGATCATSTAGMAGGVTAGEGFNMAANGGFTLGNGDAAVMSTNVTGGATGDSVCIITSAAVQLSGVIGYVVE